uniref:c-type cytochrome biogenensis protein n=1 Tax=Galdieria phlegrea TaxID=1389228 RepID=UPI0023D88E12|nr:c-type cytochrome biogenensis protein [Galdieria phlegrea]WDA99856.1 c-type cytochrome biogenensis protein [Galdieria phlegrea]
MLRLKKNFIFWLILKFSSNLNFAIILLFIIAITSLLGTIIEQNQSLEYYKLNYPEKFIPLLSWKTISILSLDKIYTSWWYSLLLFTLGFSLLSCTFLNQLPLLNLAKIVKFYSNLNTLKKFPLLLEIKNNNLYQYTKIFLKQKYTIIQHKNQLYSYSGLISKIAPIFVHISMIFILIGAIWGFFTGFIAQQMIVEGESMHIQNVIQSGFLSKIPQNFFIKINKFWIEYNNNGSISQFFSDISIYDNLGHKKISKIISVNNPLIYKNITFYQSDWNLQAIRIHFEDKYLEFPFIETFNKNTKFWISKILLDDKVFYFIADNLNKDIYIYDQNMILINKTPVNLKFNLYNKPLEIKKLIASTGIQIKYDSGIPIVYLGFFFLMISTVISYFSFNQIWILRVNKDTIYLTGQTNRAKISFKQYLFRITKKI